MICLFILPFGPQLRAGENPGAEKVVIKMTLADSVFLVLRNNRTIKSAYINRTKEKFDLKVAEDEFNPHLSADISASYGSSGSGDAAIKSTSGDFSLSAQQKVVTGGEFRFIWANSADTTRDGLKQTEYGTSWDLSFSQPLLRGGGINTATASVRTARIREQLNILNFKSTVMDTVTSTIVSFRNYMLAKRQLEISEQSLERARQLFDINKALIKAGRMAEVEIVQTEADIANRELSLISSKNALEAARLSLIRVLDIDRETRFEPVDEPDITDISLNPEELKSTAFKNRPDYLQALLNYETAKINYELAKNNQLWDFVFDAGIGKSSSAEEYAPSLRESGNIGKADWRFGLRLNIPITDLSRPQLLLGAKTSLEQMELTLKEMRESIEIEIQDRVRDIEMKLSQVKLARLATGLAERKLDIENEKLKAGRSSNFQLVNFQSDLVNSQNTELNAVIDYLNALTSLDKTLGTTLMTWKIEIEDGGEIKTAMGGPDEQGGALYK